MIVAVCAQAPVSVPRAVQRAFSSRKLALACDFCVSARMSEWHGCRLSEVEATILRESGSFWPGSVLDKDTFMDLLASVLSLEFHYQISEWEKQLIASGALGDAGKVDVQRFVAVSWASTTLSDPDTILMPEAGPQSLAPTSGTVSQIAVSQADDARETLTTMSTMTTTSGDAQLPLPASEVTAGIVVSVASKHYEISETLGCGAGGSVHRATPRREAADTGAGLGQGGPDSVALKLAG
eukprot:1915947-Amphidinium_carterae.1